MIEYRKGDLLDVTTGVIIHGCNSHGVMGSGVALAVKNKYPVCFKRYRAFCDAYNGNVIPNILGEFIPYQHGDLSIVNMITQKDYGTHQRQVNYGAIAKGFSDAHQYFEMDQEFHFPKIGAGLGGGDWEVISEIIDIVCLGRKLICWELE